MNIQLLRDEVITQVVGGGAMVIIRYDREDSAPLHLTVAVALRSGTEMRTLVDRAIGPSASEGVEPVEPI